MKLGEFSQQQAVLLKPFKWRRRSSLPVLLAAFIGVGVNSSVFTVAHSVLFRRVPIPEPERICFLWEVNPRQGTEETAVRAAVFSDWRARSRTFDAVAGFTYGPLIPDNANATEEIQVAFVAGDFFSVLKAHAYRGTLFSQHSAGTTRLAVLSYRYWVSRLHADEGVIGKIISLRSVLDEDSRTAYTIVGVADPGVDFPYPYSTEHPAVWVTHKWAPLALVYRKGDQVVTFGRLARTASLQQAQVELNTIAGNLEKEYPASNSGWRVKVVPLHDQIVRRAKQSLYLLLAVGWIVLLIATVDILGIFLADVESMRKETAIRAVLGATPAQVFVGVLARSVLLCFAGGMLGFATVALCFRPLADAVIRYANWPSAQPIRFRLAVLVFGLSVSGFTGIMAGLPAAAVASRRELYGFLRDSADSMFRRDRLVAGGGILIAAQVALAVCLVGWATVVTRSLLRLQAPAIKYDPEKIFGLRVVLPMPRYSEPYRQVEYFQRTLDTISLLRGVRSVAAVTELSAMSGIPIELEPINYSTPRVPSRFAYLRSVTIGYFRVLRVSLKRGRLFSARDGSPGVRSMIINEALARMYWGDQDPVGRAATINYSPGQAHGMGKPWTIVGVVENTYDLLGRTAPPEAYLPYSVEAPDQMLYVLIEGDPSAFSSALAEIRALDRAVYAGDVRSFGQLMASALGEPRLLAWALSAFAVLALVLTAVGVYGIVSYTTAQRSHEFAIRMALGADRGRVSVSSVRQAIMLASTGSIVGVAFALFLAPAAPSWVDVSALRASLAASVCVVMIAAALAGYWPAAKSGTRNPSDLLRMQPR